MSSFLPLSWSSYFIGEGKGVNDGTYSLMDFPRLLYFSMHKFIGNISLSTPLKGFSDGVLDLTCLLTLIDSMQCVVSKCFSFFNDT
uniref:Uncharacterized protein n=1 Tax=Lepeophtheirus salmonis TaxID=72036 RepID=A0A0K2UJ87_LEPSM